MVGLKESHGVYRQVVVHLSYCALDRQTERERERKRERWTNRQTERKRYKREIYRDVWRKSESV